MRPLAAGFGQVLIQPHLGQTLSRVQGVVPTIRGPVFIQAANAPGLFRLLVDIPGNVTATVMLPTLGVTNPVALVDGGVVSGTVSNNWLITTNLGSGQHAIWLHSGSVPSQATLYDNWTAGWFGTNADNAAPAGPSADPDGDGISNFNEFLAGANPLEWTAPVRILSVSLMSGPHLILSGSSGMPEASFHVLTSTNLALPPAQWTATGTGAFDSGGQFSVTNTIPPGGSQNYFIIQVP